MQQHPIVRLDAGFLVLDEHYLWERVTEGLYWIVHDHERDAVGDAARQTWTQAYGEMIELMVEDQLRRIAPPILGGGTSFYTEEDFSRAYAGKTCDAAIHFGAAIGLFEVVSGQLTVGTRIKGDPESFKADTEKLVIKKCRQLHEASLSVLNDETRLTGAPAIEALRVLPVIVVGGGYPVNLMTIPYVKEALASERLLDTPHVERPAIIDLPELEMLEGLAANGGITPIDAIQGWLHSDFYDGPLRNYLLATYGSTNQLYRPPRMKESVDQVFDEMLPRLMLRGGPGGTQPRQGDDSETEGEP
jgi:hypothetical protein